MRKKQEPVSETIEGLVHKAQPLDSFMEYVKSNYAHVYLIRVPERATVPRHFVVWYPNDDEPDGETYTRFVSLQAMVDNWFKSKEVKV